MEPTAPENLSTPDRKEIRYEGLSWGKSRSTMDMFTAYIQRGARFTNAPEYEGLLNEQELKEQALVREKERRAWQNPKNPNQIIDALAANRWNAYTHPPQVGISGRVFLSERLKHGRSIPDGQRNEGRLSFSLNPEKAPMFFDYMMTLISTGPLADIPVSFKMADFYPGDQRTGEDAHLYFDAQDEERLYDIMVTQQYPNLLKSDYLTFGGRFPMLPIEDMNGSALKGIEFGQGMFKRDSIPIDARNKLLDSTANKGLATSGVISLVMGNIQSELTPEKFERLRNRYRLQGKAGLLSDKEFSESYTLVKQSLIGLGRDENYPILDRDAQKVFPHFTKAITSFSP